MSTSGTDGPSSEENPTLAERIMNPDGGDNSGGDNDSGDRGSSPVRRLRRHVRTPRERDARAGGATVAGSRDADTTDEPDRLDTDDNDRYRDQPGDAVRDDTSSNDLQNDDTDYSREDNGDHSTDDTRDFSRDDTRDFSRDDTRDFSRDGGAGGYDREDETVVQSAVGDNDEAPGGYDRPRNDADLDSTQAMPAYEDEDSSDSGVGAGGAAAGGAAAGGAAGAAGAAGSKRRVTRDELYAREDRQGERDRLERARAEHQASAQDTAVDQQPVSGDQDRKRRKVKPPRTTDKFFGAFGLFVLRVLTGVVMGVHGVQKLLNMDGTAQFFSQLEFFGTPLPQAGLLAIITGAAEALIGVSLIFGFLTRLSGLGVLLITVGALLMVKMTSLPNPFAGGESGFDGELELILAGVGLLFLLVGGGGWALDRLFRRRPRTDALDDEL
ncbi:DoxX family membrane protein [Propionibacteriaceae bacterium Y1685]